MFNSIFSALRPKKKAKPEDKSDDIPGFIPAFDNIQDFKSQHNLTCPVKTVAELIIYLQVRKEKPHPINVGVYEEFPAEFEELKEKIILDGSQSNQYLKLEGKLCIYKMLYYE
jgi:hypothetical protein